MVKRQNGKFYDIDDNVLYEIKDGKRKVKEHDYNGKFKFEGEYSWRKT